MNQLIIKYLFILSFFLMLGNEIHALDTTSSETYTGKIARKGYRGHSGEHSVTISKERRVQTLLFPELTEDQEGRYYYGDNPEEIPETQDSPLPSINENEDGGVIFVLEEPTEETFKLKKTNNTQTFPNQKIIENPQSSSQNPTILDPIAEVKEKGSYPIKDPSISPWVYHGTIISKFGENTFYVGTGTLIGGDCVLTAGHNLFKPELGPTKAVIFYPGRSDKVKWRATATRIAIHPEYYSKENGYSKKAQYDIGLIKLNTALGESIGFVGVQVLTDDELKALKKINITGYPGNGEMMFGMHGPVHPKTDDIYLYHELPTEKGHSGSGIWTDEVLSGMDKGDLYCVAVHTYGKSKIHEFPCGTRITDSVYDRMETWKQEFEKK